MIKIYYDAFRGHHGEENFGDALTPALIGKLSGQDIEIVPVGQVNKKGEIEAIHDADIVASGSILEYVPDDYKGYIWGTGFMFEHSRKSFPKANILAVRGAMTRNRINNIDPATPLGDPGLLSTMFPHNRDKTKRRGIAVVPHYIDRMSLFVQQLLQKQGIDEVNILSPVHEFIAKLSMYASVLSSSLHGLIVADALDIENCYMRFSEKVAGNGFKFRDYWSSFSDRDAIPAIQRKLIDVFPYKKRDEK